MCAALSIQLSLVKEFSRVGIAVFDEPTTNLDEGRRDLLANTIGKVREDYNFEQLFIISHDTAFSSMTEQEIHLIKRDNITANEALNVRN
jgi:exonuclease SbcC